MQSVCGVIVCESKKSSKQGSGGMYVCMKEKNDYYLETNDVDQCTSNVVLLFQDYLLQRVRER